MAENRNNIYRGFEMTSGVDGDLANGFRVVAQWMRLTTQGTLTKVAIDGLAAGCFSDLPSAFNASVQRIQQAIDDHIDGPSIR